MKTFLHNKQTTKKQNRNTCLKGITQPKKGKESSVIIYRPSCLWSL